ncbi:MAG: hypothetical protein ACTSXQ_03970 [Alphaproteobacteria bacterium]
MTELYNQLMSFVNLDKVVKYDDRWEIGNGARLVLYTNEDALLDISFEAHLSKEPIQLTDAHTVTSMQAKLDIAATFTLSSGTEGAVTALSIPIQKRPWRDTYFRLGKADVLSSVPQAKKKGKGNTDSPNEPFSDLAFPKIALESVIGAKKDRRSLRKDLNTFLNNIERLHQIAKADYLKIPVEQRTEHVEGLLKVALSEMKVTKNAAPVMSDEEFLAGILIKAKLQVAAEKSEGLDKFLKNIEILRKILKDPSSAEDTKKLLKVALTEMQLIQQAEGTILENKEAVERAIDGAVNTAQEKLKMSESANLEKFLENIEILHEILTADYPEIHADKKEAHIKELLEKVLIEMQVAV